MDINMKKVGELLVEQELITREHLLEALDLQKVFPDQPVGQLLCKRRPPANVINIDTHISVRS